MNDAVMAPWPRQDDVDEEVLHGVVRRITFTNPENQYMVLRLDCQDGKPPVTVVGHLVPVPAQGEEIRALGRWTVHQTYGRQFEAVSYQTVSPSTAEGVERLLASGAIKGVGPATARRLVASFGVHALDVIASQPEKLATVPGISAKKARAIAEQFGARRAEQETLVFLHSLGLGPGLARRILRRYGLSAPAALRAHPYQLAFDVDGFGFRRADELAARFDVAVDSPERVEAALWHALQDAVDDGHVFLPRAELFERALSLLQSGRGAGGAWPDEVLQRCLGVLAQQGAVVMESDAVYPPAHHRWETELAERLARMANRPRQPWLPARFSSELAWAERAFGTALAVEQREAVRKALEEGILVVTGGPGTGKTTLVRFVVHLAKRAGVRVALAAPTGRAAQRLHDAVLGGGVSPEGVGVPRTIHRLLEVKAGPASGSRFGRGPNNPIDAELVIVDEVSMLDLQMAYHLVTALSPSARLMLVGDVNQLPSVGPGQVLRDVIDSGRIPVVRLARLFRQAARSRIVVGAHQILEGKSLVHSRSSASTAGRQGGGCADRAKAQPSDLRFTEEPTPEAAAQRIRELVGNLASDPWRFDPKRDIQVLTASHRGPAGSDALNAMLQDILNPADSRRRELRVGGRVLREGDRVMQVRNEYQARLVAEEADWPGADAAQETEVFNGEIGTVERVLPEERLVLVRFDDGRLIEYDDERLSQIQLAYAITVHKSQGNEFPCVIMPVVWTMPALMTRHLLYTALTRGRRLVALVGQRAAVQAYVRNAAVAERHSQLARRLRDAA